MCRKLSSSPFKKTKGNANGMGLADVITRRLFEEIDYPSTYANIITSCYLDGAPVPIPMANDREAIQLAIKTLVRVVRGEERIVRIKDTLSIETISVSQPMLWKSKSIPTSPSWKIPNPSVFRKMEFCRPCFEMPRKN